MGMGASTLVPGALVSAVNSPSRCYAAPDAMVVAFRLAMDQVATVLAVVGGTKPDHNWSGVLILAPGPRLGWVYPWELRRVQGA